MARGWNERLRSLYAAMMVEILPFVPFLPLKSSSWGVGLSVFFLVREAPFLSKVMGLYCGRLLNFLSNSSSNFPSLKDQLHAYVQRLIRFTSLLIDQPFRKSEPTCSL